MTSVLAASRSALKAALIAARPDVVLDRNGYVGDARENLIEGVSIADFEADLLQGDGNELAGKFRAAHSSSALAVNTFGRFKSRPRELVLAASRGFDAVQFERKCPHGIIGRRSPNLDLLAEGASGVVAIESKCLETLTPHAAVFSGAYNAEIRDYRRATPWFREMLLLTEAPRRYRWLDAAQLVKHAFGIAHTFPEKPTILLYLFWEPSDADVHPIFSEHRAEITRFAKAIGGSTPNFLAMSYPELWRAWENASAPLWLQLHIERLKARYGIAIADAKADPTHNVKYSV